MISYDYEYFYKIVLNRQTSFFPYNKSIILINTVCMIYLHNNATQYKRIKKIGI